jgi:hypothetical protein
MGQNRFDTLTRSLTVAGSRRRALAAALSGTLGLLGWKKTEDAVAHNASTACKTKSGQQKKKCLKRAKKHNATHAVAAPPPPPTCAEQCPSTCSRCWGRKGGGPPLCGDAAAPTCAETCTSDQDCVHTSLPYCITTNTDRELGTTTLICGGDGVCADVHPC